MRPTIHCADVLDWAAAYQGEPFHALLCDPPYELGFMGRQWDATGIAFRPETWRAFWPLLHPGAFGMAFAGSRGWHRMAVAIEDAGYIIHPTMFLYCYGSGFPKSTRIKGCECAERGKSASTQTGASHYVPGLQHAEVRTASVAEEGQESLLLAELSQPSDYQIHSDSEQVRSNGNEVSRDGVTGRQEPGLERRRDVQAQQGQLHRAEVHSMPAGISADGAQGRLRDGASDRDGAVSTATVGAGRSSTPHRPQHTEQRSEQPRTMAGQHQPQSDGARSYCDRCGLPIVDAWQGHRYGLQALKPAVEPIIVFQKPYAGRPVDSITATGAGALNIAAGRIAGEPWIRDNTRGQARIYDGWGMRPNVKENTSGGRWPSNLILQHHELCEPIGERRVRTAWSQPTRGDKSGSYLFNVGNAQQGQSIGYTDADGYETITAWRCAPGCAVAALGAQSGDVRSAGMYTKGANGVGAKAGPASVPVDGLTSATYADAGNAARFFYNADWQAERLEAADAVIYQAKASTAEREAGLSGRQKRELQMHYMSPDTSGNSHNTTGQHAAVRANVHPTIKPIALAEHLARLLLPPALYAPRRLFVPFAGAGSECIGAMRAGWEHVEGVELEEDHVSIARARIDYWAERGTQPSLFEGDE